MAELSQYFKSIIDQDTQAVVVCNLMHEIVYMNPAAVEEYSDRGGEKLIGLLIFDCHSKASSEKIEMVVKRFSASKENNIIHTSFSESRNMDFYMVALRDEDGKLIGYYEKHESRTRDTARPYGMSGH